MFYFASRAVCFVFLKTFFSLRVFGQENVPKKGGFILASNHVSFLDPVAVGVACPRKLNYMARDTLFSNRLFAWLLNDCGSFPLKRDSADLSALKEAIKRLKSGQGLLLFPEGRRSADKDTLLKPRAGVGFLASKLKVPVIPALVKGTDRALPRGAKFFRSSNISVIFGKQILIERRMPYKDIAQQVINDIRHLSC